MKGKVRLRGEGKVREGKVKRRDGVNQRKVGRKGRGEGRRGNVYYEKEPGKRKGRLGKGRW
jgi:hypothetical protein